MLFRKQFYFDYEHNNYIITQQSPIFGSLDCFKSHCFGVQHLFARKKKCQIHYKVQREKLTLNLGKNCQTVPVFSSWIPMLNIFI